MSGDTHGRGKQCIIPCTAKLVVGWLFGNKPKMRAGARWFRQYPLRNGIEQYRLYPKVPRHLGFRIVGDFGGFVQQIFCVIFCGWPSIRFSISRVGRDSRRDTIHHLASELRFLRHYLAPPAENKFSDVTPVTTLNWTVEVWL